MLEIDLNVSVVSDTLRLKRIFWLFGYVMLSFVISISSLYTIFVLKTDTWTSVRQDAYKLADTGADLCHDAE